MTRICLLTILIALLSAQSFAQDSLFGSRFDQYERLKKEFAVGFMYSLILPGAGLFYTGEPLTGIGFLVATVGTAVWFVNEENYSLPAGLVLVLVRLVEFGIVKGNVDSFNQQIRKQLNLTLYPNSHHGLSLRLSMKI